MQTTILQSKPVTSVSISKIFEFDLEGLRGFAALLVIWCHAIGMPRYLDPGYNPSGIAGYQAPAHFCVLIFFVLSGYVIGISTKGQLSIATAGTYLKKRFLRIYPIYALCLLLAVAVATTAYSWRVITGSLLFLQIARTDMIRENDPSWSLQYEVLYYLLFVPLSLVRINALLVAAGCLVLGVVNMYFRPAAPLLSSYSFGFVFWCCGLALAQYSSRWPRTETSYRVLLSIMLLFLSFPTFTIERVLQEAIHKAGFQGLVYRQGLDMYQAMITPLDLTYLLYAVAGVLLFSHKQFPLREWLMRILFFVSGLGLIPMVLHWHTLNHAWCLITSLAYSAALLLYFSRATIWERIGKKILAVFINVGSISYGLYIVHMPILFLFKRIDFFSGSAASYWIRFILFIPSSFFAAYILEKRFQPLARKAFSFL